MSAGPGSPPWRRLFLASRLDPRPAAELARRAGAALGPEGERLRLVRAADLHVTLHFLGRVGEERLDELARAVAGALRGARAPRGRLVGTGAFPSRARPRILWVGADRDLAAGLTGLAGRLTTACGSLGLDPDPRPFSAHVTIARVRRGASPARAALGGFFGLELSLEWQPGAVELVETPADGGPYRTRISWPLPAGGNPASGDSPADPGG